MESNGGTMEAKNKKWLSTKYPHIVFEDNEVGRMKKELFEAPMSEIDRILEDYGIPSPSELGKGGSYIQTTPRYETIEKRRKNDVLLIPIGCSENHGDHANTGLDTFMVTQICEAVRRKSIKQGCEVNITLPPLNFGAHPYHHIGMPGTVIIPSETVKEMLIYTMLGFWNDGYRKMVLINNHGHLWVLVDAIQEFMKRFQLPAIVQVIDWHRAVREFFYPTDEEDSLSTHFIHAAEAETSVARLLFDEMINMDYVKDAQGEQFLPEGHFDLSVDPYRRPHRWSEGEGHFAIERYATPEGVVGTPSKGEARKAKRPIAAILKYLTMTVDHILQTFPAGVLPDIQKVSNRDLKELEAFLKEPWAEGWKSVYELPQVGPFHKN
ncbi:3-dehydro-scyllo-inosose hydrolase-like [Ylistrum balloti]|uniref:3-dehydro-scyllo-inosose hydrolase-like n=1 Tax=Ylistrum balloti TaxID=509963 RepID=UPI002905D6AF|nr:3-dehydro-scyllo-inosose hydrolase-like [Ylistrum balloti]